MYEYVGTETKSFRIGNKWVFFDKGTIVAESEKKFAETHGVNPSYFVLKETKPLIKEIEVKPVIEEEKTRRKRRK